MAATAAYVEHGVGVVRHRPTFIGLVRGELFKVSRQRLTWFMLLALAGIICFPYVIGLSRSGLKVLIEQAPLVAVYRDMSQGFFVLRVFSGIVLVLITSRLIGMEYSSGTVRVLLARGVGRVQLLAAKLVTVALIALAIFGLGCLLDYVMTVASLRMVTGNLDALNAVDSTFWSDTRLIGVSVLISMGVTILMAAAVTTVARSLAGGMSTGLAWFPADNIGLILFYLAFSLTKSDFWNLATGDLLGPNINALADHLISTKAQHLDIGFGRFNAPFVPVTSGHILLVIGLYAAAFLVVAVGMTWWRDVTE